MNASDDKYSKMIKMMCRVSSGLLSFDNTKMSKKNYDDLDRIKNEYYAITDEFLNATVEFRIDEEFDAIESRLNEIDVNMTKLKDSI